MKKIKTYALSKIGRKAIGVSLVVSMVNGSIVNADPVGDPAFVLKGDVIVAEDIKWVSPSLQADHNVLSIDLTQHFNQLLDANSLSITGISSDTNIATSSISGKMLHLVLHSAGTATISITGTDQSGKSLTDRFHVTVTKTGDTDGDGIITPADSLFIYKVISNKVQLTDDEKKLVDIDGDGQITAKDATAVMNAYNGKTSIIQNNQYYITLKDVNDAPEAFNIQVSGATKVGQTLTGTYEYMDIENDTEAGTSFQWYRSNQSNGQDKVAIAGATTGTYQLTDEDSGKYLSFEVTPGSSNGMGSAVISQATDKIVNLAPLLQGFTWTQGSVAGTTKATAIPNGELKYIIQYDDQMERPYEGDVADAYTNLFTEEMDIPASKNARIYIVSVDSDNKITGWAKEYVNDQNVKQKTPPTLVADQSINHVGKEIAVTFTEDQNWVTGITDIMIDNNLVKPEDYTITNGTITFDKKFFTSLGDYQINISSTNYEDTSIKQTVEANEAPSVSQVKIMGSLQVGKTITSSYQYNDIENDSEGNSTYQWYRSDLADGSDKVAIVGANSKDYVLQNEDENKFMTVEVTPMASTGFVTGNTVLSETSEQVTLAVNVSLVATTDPVELSEDTLNAAVMYLTLSGDTANLDTVMDDIVLNNAPQGLIAYAMPMDENNITLLLDYEEGTDFDQDISNFSVTIKGSSLSGGQDVTTDNLMIKAINESNAPTAFISEYLYGDNGNIAIELSNVDDVFARKGNNYTLELYQWNKSLNKKTITSVDLFENADTGYLAANPYIIIDKMAYSIFDDIPLAYYNEEAELSNNVTNLAFVLKRDGQVVDVLGDMNAASSTSPAIISSKGKTMIRKPGFYGGSTTYYQYQWKTINTDIYKYLGNHQAK